MDLVETWRVSLICWSRPFGGLRDGGTKGQRSSSIRGWLQMNPLWTKSLWFSLGWSSSMACRKHSKSPSFSRTTTSWDLGTAILHSLPSCLRTCHFTRVMQVDNLTPRGCNEPRSPGLVLDPFWEGGGIILATTKNSRPHPTWRLKLETWLVTHRSCAPAVRPSAPVCGTYPGSWLLEFRQLSFRSCRWRRNRCSSMRSRFLSRFSIGVRALACGYCEGTIMCSLHWTPGAPGTAGYSVGDAVLRLFLVVQQSSFRPCTAVTAVTAVFQLKGKQCSISWQGCTDSCMDDGFVTVCCPSVFCKNEAWLHLGTKEHMWAFNFRDVEIRTRTVEGTLQIEKSSFFSLRFQCIHGVSNLHWHANRGCYKRDTISCCHVEHVILWYTMQKRHV